MEWLIHTFFFIVLALLLVQAFHCAKGDQPKAYVRWFGVLIVLLVLLISIVYVLQATESFLISTDLGLLLVRGAVGKFSVISFIFVLVIASALGWYVALLASGKKTYRMLLLCATFTMAILSIAPIFFYYALNPLDTFSQQIYSYDIWWPFLLIWISLCVIDTALISNKVNHWQIRLWVITTIVTLLAYSVLQESLPLYTYTMFFWKVFYVILLSGNVSLGVWLVLQPLDYVTHVSPAHRKHVNLPLIGIMLGLIGALLWLLYNNSITITRPMEIWIFYLIVISTIFAFRLYRFKKTFKGNVTGKPKKAIFKVGAILLTFFAIALITLGMMDFTVINPQAFLIVAALGWIVVAEIALPGPLKPFANWGIVQEIKKAQFPLKQINDRLRERLNSLKKVFATFFDPQQKWYVILVKALSVVICIIALNEIPNINKTIVQTFKAKVDGTNTDQIGKLTTENLVHSLISFSRDLQPEDIQLGKIKQKQKYVPPTADATNVLAASSPIEIGSFKIPVQSLVGWIQTPIRYLIGVRIVDGTLYQEDSNTFSLLAGSTSLYGKPTERWRVSGIQAVSSVKSISKLSDSLALHIMQSDIGSPIVPRNDQAFVYFEKGLEAWKKYKNIFDLESLTKAVQYFRESVQTDPAFALGYYRLGMALRDDGQPGSAIEAFRTAITTDPNLVAAKLELATTLIDFDGFYYVPAGVRPPETDVTENRTRLIQSRRLLLEVIDSAKDISRRNLGAAYYNLCRTTDKGSKPFLAFYYCARAAKLYEKLSAIQSTRSQIRSDVANVLNEIGIIFESFDRQNSLPYDVEEDWRCPIGITLKNRLYRQTANEPKLISNKNFILATRYYYGKALKLDPDNSIVRSNLFNISYVDGASQQLQDLMDTSAVHVQHAVEFRTQANNLALGTECEKSILAPELYLAALDEYSKAVHPTADNKYLFEALSGFAYTFWMFRINLPEESTRYLSFSYAQNAEDYARKALRMAENMQFDLKATAQQTLGEVLMAVARPKEAMKVLDDAVKVLETANQRDKSNTSNEKGGKQQPQPPAEQNNAEQVPGSSTDHDKTKDKSYVKGNNTSTHPLYHDLYWDKAQAYMCSLINDKNAGLLINKDDKRLQTAYELLGTIRQEEKEREYKPFTDSGNFLDPDVVVQACIRDNKGVSKYDITVIPKNDEYFIMDNSESSYEADKELCNWSGVKASVSEGMEKFILLHIWGGDINSYVPADGHTYVSLGAPKDTHNYYFVQLQDLDHNPVSKVYSLTTKKGCSQNIINLEFKTQSSS